MTECEDFIKIMSLIQTKDDNNISLAWQIARGRKYDLDLLAFLINTYNPISCSLTFIRKIYLKFIDNPYHNIFDLIGKLENLKSLNIYGNQELFSLLDNTYGFKTLPIEICNLKRLTHLNICNNNLNTLPNEFSNLKMLKRLYISNNNLQEIPHEVLELENLEELIINNNDINTIPKNIGKLKKLKFLYINSNMVEELKILLPKTNIM